MRYVMRSWIICNVIFFNWICGVWAQTTSSDDPKSVVDNYSTQMIAILKGPIAKVLSFVILLACVAALLRGRHKLAVSTGIAFIVLLFLQVI